MLIVSGAYFFGSTAKETDLLVLSANGWISLTLCCLFLVISLKPWATLLAAAESLLVIYSSTMYYLMYKSIYIEAVYDYYPVANTLVYILELVVLGNIALQEVRDAYRNYRKRRDSGDHLEFSRI